MSRLSVLGMAAFSCVNCWPLLGLFALSTTVSGLCPVGGFYKWLDAFSTRGHACEFQGPRLG